MWFMGGHGVAAEISQLAALQAEGRRAWPEIRVAPDALQHGLVQWRARAHAANEPQPDLAEVYLAIGCSVDAPRALQALEDHYVRSALPALRGFGLDDDELAEVLQRMRVRLLVGKGVSEPPALVRYAGRGRLGGLVRVTLLREARRWKLQVDRERPAVVAPMPGPAPQTELGRIELQSLLKASTEVAVRCLDARSRTLLRLHYVRGIPSAAIARMYGVHRGTVGRWLATARLRLADSVHADLRSRLPVGARDLGLDLRELANSQLDLSLSRVLRQTGPATTQAVHAEDS